MHFFSTFVIVLILLKFTLFLYHDSFILWCSDGLNEADRIAWQNRLVEVEKNIKYWRKDVIDLSQNLEFIEQEKHLVANDEYLKEKNDTLADKVASERNLRSEERMLNNLLNKGPQPFTSTQASTAGTVRDISEVSGSNEQGPTKR